MSEMNVNSNDKKILDELKANGEAAEWMTVESYQTLSRGYLLSKETPKGMYTRIAKAAASYYPNSEKWEKEFFDAMWKNWLCPSSPICANLGTDRGLPISCNSIHVDDSVDSIFNKNYELAMLAKHGAGVGIYIGDIRARGIPIKNNGFSEGVVPWSRLYDTTTTIINQGSTRRGASALFLPIEHGDIEEFINIRRPTGDLNRRCLNVHHGVSISNEWMESMLAGDKKKRNLYQDILRARIETGEPYIMFSGNINDVNPDCYKDKGLTVKTSNICSEIVLFTDPDHSFVCCLSSLNLVRWNEWKDTNLINLAVRFLDAVMSDYIEKSKNIHGLESARRFAEKSRAIGIGVLGWHTLLQDNSIPFDSFEAMQLNAEIFRTLRSKADEETKILAEELGEPEWCIGHKRRNTHCIAIAPTVSNSIISGGYSAGIEPLVSNIYNQKTAKGTFIRKNPALQKLLQEKNKDTSEIWKSINEQSGSVQHLDFLTDHEKEVFLTAYEINQHAIIKQQIQRNRWIDQSVSLNLFFASNADPKYIHDVHISAWKGGVKTLYYLRSQGVLKSDIATRSADECKACEA